MATNPESTLTRKIVSHLESFGCLCIKYHASQFTPAGIPDLIVIRGGVTVWLEIKTSTGRLSKIQIHRHQQMRRYGSLIATVRTPEEAFDFVSEHCPTNASIHE